MPMFHIRAIDDQDRAWVRDFITQQWHSDTIVSRGRVHYPHQLQGFLAFEGDRRAESAGNLLGLVTYHLEGDACEIVTLDSFKEGVGIGTALIASVKQTASEVGWRRLWLITTNDNTHALRFYQKRGFRLVALYPNAIAESRRLKPQIPLIGNDGIPLTDELELELML